MEHHRYVVKGMVAQYSSIQEIYNGGDWCGMMIKGRVIEFSSS